MGARGAALGAGDVLLAERGSEEEEAMGTVGLAVIGVGGIGALRAQVARDSAQVGFLAVCDLDAERAGAAGERCRADLVSGDYREVIEDGRVNAVVVSTHEEAHGAPALLAAGRGKPVLVEKPFTLRLEEADAVLEAARRSGAPVFVGFTQRFRRRYLMAKEAVARGALGDVVSALGKIYITQAVAEAVISRSPHTTPSINTLTYMVDLILWYLEGKRPTSLYARAGSFVFREPYGAPDFTWALLGFEDGSTASLGVSWLLPKHHPAYTATMEVDLHGTRGALHIDDSHRDQVLCTEEATPAPYTPDVTMSVAFPGSHMPGEWAVGEFWGPLRSETESFLAHVATGRPTALATGEHGRLVLEVTLAADRSAQEDRPVALPLT
ncbi:MAG: Gfo/Idh/MocA family protein [Nitrospinota bacterium]